MRGIFDADAISVELFEEAKKRLDKYLIENDCKQPTDYQVYDLIYLAWLFAHHYLSAQKLPSQTVFYDQHVTETLLEALDVPFDRSRFSFSQVASRDLFEWYLQFHLADFEEELLEVKPCTVTRLTILNQLSAEDKKHVLTHFKRLYDIEYLSEKEELLYCLSWLWHARMLNRNKEDRLVINSNYVDIDFDPLIAKCKSKKNRFPGYSLQDIIHEYRLDELSDFLAWTFTEPTPFYIAQHLKPIPPPELALLPFRIDSSILASKLSSTKKAMIQNLIINAGGHMADDNLLTELVFLCYLYNEGYLRKDRQGKLWVDGKRVDFKYYLFHENNTDRHLNLNRIFTQFNIKEATKILKVRYL